MPLESTAKSVPKLILFFIFILAIGGRGARVASLWKKDIGIMSRVCELTGKRPQRGNIIWRSGKAKKKGGIGTHITAITKRRFMPNLQHVKAVVDGEIRYIMATAKAIKKGLVVKPPKRINIKKAEVKAA